MTQALRGSVLLWASLSAPTNLIQQVYSLPPMLDDKLTVVNPPTAPLSNSTDEVVDVAEYEEVVHGVSTVVSKVNPTRIHLPGTMGNVYCLSLMRKSRDVTDCASRQKRSLLISAKPLRSSHVQKYAAVFAIPITKTDIFDVELLIPTEFRPPKWR